MTTDRELLEMALEALDDACGGRCNAEYNPCYQQATAKTIRTALAEPEKQAPYIAVCNDRIKIDPVTGDVSIGTPALQSDLAKVGEVGVWGEPVIDKSAAKRIATQLGWEPKREWQGLTKDDIREIIIDLKRPEDLYKAIEAKLKERNT